MKKLLWLCSFLVVSFSVATAQVGIEQYEGVKDQEWFKSYAYGVGTGYFWANTMLEELNKERLFCPPEKLTLNKENYLRILDETVEENFSTEDTRDNYIELALLLGLRKTFPCTK